MASLYWSNFLRPFEYLFLGWYVVVQLFHLVDFYWTVPFQSLIPQTLRPCLCPPSGHKPGKVLGGWLLYCGLLVLESNKTSIRQKLWPCEILYFVTIITTRLKWMKHHDSLTHAFCAEKRIFIFPHNINISTPEAYFIMKIIFGVFWVPLQE